MQELAKEYLRQEALPFIFCPGCGDGQILSATIRVIAELDIRNDLAAVSGIGCSGWIPVYLDIDVIHAIHGRAIAFAEGLKLSCPEKKVIVFTGDGDCAGIGGNHFIHAARRNIDLTVIMVNNYIYGMTGGQKAPTTPLKVATKTSPHGNAERPFDMFSLAIASGATYVARWTTAHLLQLEKAIKKGIEHTGFSFIEVMAQCPVQSGRSIFKTSDAWEIMNWYKENTDSQSTEGKILIGEFINKGEIEFTRLLAEIKEGFDEGSN